MDYIKVTATVSMASVAFVLGAMNANAQETSAASTDVWTGAYFGLEANVMGGTLPQRSNGSEDSYYDMNGSYAPGVFMGVNKQFGDWVVGGEVSALFGAVVGSPSDGNTFGSTWGAYSISHLVDLNGRVGYAMDNALFYVTAGGSTGQVTAQYGNSYSTWGVNFGAGVDYKIDDKLSVGVQYKERNLNGYNTDDGEMQEFNTSTLSLRAAYNF